MQCCATIVFKLTKPPVRRAAKIKEGGCYSGDFIILIGRYWGIGTKPVTIKLYVFGSDFRALEELDPEQGPLLVVSNLFFSNPQVWVNAQGQHVATNVGIVNRGSQISILAFGHKDKPVRRQFMAGEEDGDGRRVDRPGQGNDPLDLIIKGMGG